MPPFHYNFSKSIIEVNFSKRYPIEDASQYLVDDIAYLREMEAVADPSVRRTAIPSLILVNQSELQIWSLQISSLERISARNCVLTFLEHHQSTQHGWHSLFA